MKGIIGAISGDIIGSTREFDPIKTKDFDLFTRRSIFTDDTIMTLAVAKWLCENKDSKDVLIKNLKYFGNLYPNAGYGGRFYEWLRQDSPEPYGSWANGSAMRVSPCAWVADTLEEAQDLAYTSAVVTHNHPEGIKGALATVDAIYLARVGASKDEIKDHVEVRYEYDLSRPLDEIRSYYSFDVSCKGSVPESIICFLEANDFEDAVRNAVSLGGDADTQAAIAGSIASAFWDVPKSISYKTIHRLDYTLLNVFIDFEEKFNSV
ncbi:ADP-ribosylglycohydrolase family protein [Methanobrevibacter sp.]|uniref:ADP-ribosylglycohydrolase family protein n=1 Tax=Methanobrevibacter sp. TaxID=66852 RepID=UPI0025D69428|nr:ADP-ribosylglycohydrolase family protein [Methanobrevibacter sp.]MBQ6098823.1 ADP-ribosylglycohydrolase family protein [Methanobrevibacter sp.]MBQ6511055.1 ADP-ribosylglycohydrolase family protein [Methanobrevibacter sp.]